jgi:hypothetical protein
MADKLANAPSPPSSQLARQGLDGAEYEFARLLLEDRNNEAQSYVDWLVPAHRRQVLQQITHLCIQVRLKHRQGRSVGVQALEGVVAKSVTIQLARQGLDGAEYEFARLLLEDRNNEAQSYVQLDRYGLGPAHRRQVLQQITHLCIQVRLKHRQGRSG